MLFNIEHDFGDEILGYVVPDAVTGSARLRLTSAGCVVWEGLAAEPRPALVAAGRHHTGLCGFRICGADAPGLAEMADVEIVDIDSGVTIYRRPVEDGALPLKTLRLETRLTPATSLDVRLAALFRTTYLQIERLGRETASQLFLLNHAPSLYLSGRLQLPAYSHMLTEEFGVIVVLRDPYVELADRLRLLCGGRGVETLAERERMTFGKAITALSGADPASPRSLRGALRRLRGRAAAELSNPLGRQLTTHRVEELCSGDAVAAGLRALAACAVAAPVEEPFVFEAALSDYLGAAVSVPQIDPFDVEREPILDALQDIRGMEALIEVDLEIYDSVVEVTAPVA